MSGDIKNRCDPTNKKSPEKKETEAQRESEMTRHPIAKLRRGEKGEQGAERKGAGGGGDREKSVEHKY